MNMTDENAARENKLEIQKYFDYTRLFYRVFWHGKTNSIHYGIYNDGVSDHKSALNNT